MDNDSIRRDQLGLVPHTFFSPRTLVSNLYVVLHCGFTMGQFVPESQACELRPKFWNFMFLCSLFQSCHAFYAVVPSVSKRHYHRGIQYPNVSKSTDHILLLIDEAEYCEPRQSFMGYLCFALIFLTLWFYPLLFTNQCDFTHSQWSKQGQIRKD